MQELQVTAEGHTRKFDRPFLVVATQNPIEQEGTYRLPEAQLDRFLFKIEVGYPSLDEEARIISEFHGRGDRNDLSDIEAVVKAEDVLHLQELVRNVRIDENLVRYIAELTSRTRNNPALFLGASPRASIAVMRAAKSIAAMRGRDFVTPEDIQHVLLPTIRHRILLTPEKEMEGVRPEEVLQGIADNVEVPR
jgi:MoxR-like ATPase